jgi:hypothetical protein
VPRESWGSSFLLAIAAYTMQISAHAHAQSKSACLITHAVLKCRGQRWVTALHDYFVQAVRIVKQDIDAPPKTQLCKMPVPR